MSIHITRFLDRIRQAESRSQRDVIMTVSEARDLHHDITRLLARLEQAQISNETDRIISVNVDGGSFR